MSKYIDIKFKCDSKTGKTKEWQVRNMKIGRVVGEVRWCGFWRKYGFFPTIQGYQWIVFDGEALMMIGSFCDQETKKHMRYKRKTKS